MLKSFLVLSLLCTGCAEAPVTFRVLDIHNNGVVANAVVKEHDNVISKADSHGVVRIDPQDDGVVHEIRFSARGYIESSAEITWHPYSVKMTKVPPNSDKLQWQGPTIPVFLQPIQPTSTNP